MKICVIIPAYNESKTIAGIIKEVRGLGLEVLVIDDGSIDDTAGISQTSGAIVLRNQVNKGKGASLVQGFNYALSQGYEAVITMDADGQHSAQDLPSFLKYADRVDSSVIIGNRMSEARSMPLLRLATNKFMSWLISNIAKQKIPDTQSGFRLIKRLALEKMNLKTTKYEIESEILIRAARLGLRIDSIPIKTIYRGEKSQINPIFDTIRFFKFISKELWNMPS